MPPEAIQALLGLFGGAAGGLFGQPQAPQLNPQDSQLFRFLMQNARQQMHESRLPPMALPQEQMALAQARGSLGNTLLQRRQMAESQFSPADAGNKADFLSNLGGQEIGALSGIDTQALLQSLNSRQAMKLNASNIAASAGGAAGGSRYQQPVPDFGSLLGGIAQSVSYGQARNSALRPAQTTLQSGTQLPPAYGAGQMGSPSIGPGIYQQPQPPGLPNWF